MNLDKMKRRMKNFRIGLVVALASLFFLILWLIGGITAAISVFAFLVFFVLTLGAIASMFIFSGVYVGFKRYLEYMTQNSYKTNQAEIGLANLKLKHPISYSICAWIARDDKQPAE